MKNPYKYKCAKCDEPFIDEQDFMDTGCPACHGDWPVEFIENHGHPPPAEVPPGDSIALFGVWSPIETAPDETWVILTDGETVECGYYGPSYFGCNYDWVQYCHRSDCEPVGISPTLWMPLPPPGNIIT